MLLVGVSYLWFVGCLMLNGVYVIFDGLVGGCLV